MAHHGAIGAISQTLVGILDDARRVPFPNAAVQTLRARSFDTNANDLPEEGIGLLLWRVAVDGSQRARPPRRTEDGDKLLPALPLALHYLLATWALDVVQAQRLLGFAMRTLEDSALLPAHLLNHYTDRPDTFRADETLELVCDTPALADWLGLWDKLKPQFVAGIPYVVRGLLIDSERVVDEAGRVTRRLFDMAVPQT